MRFTRFPYHLNLGLRPEALGIPEEHIVIADPRLVDSAVLSEVVVRQDAPLWSNLLQVKDCLNGPPEFAGEREREQHGLPVARCPDGEAAAGPIKVARESLRHSAGPSARLRSRGP